MFGVRSRWLLAGALLLSLHASAQESTPPPGRIAAPKRIPDPVPIGALISQQPAGEPVSTASMPGEVRRAVVADAAKRFRVAEDAVVLASAEQVTWSNGSLGCPKPGRTYLQVLVPGYRVTAVTAAGRMLYHADMRGNVATCALPLRSLQDADPKHLRDTGDDPRNLPPAKDAPDR